MQINLETMLGTLATYIAIMAVLAVGTEVVLDILKIKALKKPTSPSEALAELKEWMPKEDWADLEKRTKQMETLLQEVDTNLTQARASLGELRREVEPILRKYEHLTPENAMTVIRELEARYQAIRDNRLAWIRFFSLAIGIAWAVLLQINSLSLLEPIVSGSAANLLGGVDSTWYNVAGLVLTGLGAAAGSSFWYEQMARLRTTRKVVDVSEQLKSQAAAIASGIASVRVNGDE